MILKPHLGYGAGSALPFPVLLMAGLCTLFAVFVSSMSIFLHLKNYRKPFLQRMVIRIMIMVPVYGVASLISLFSLNAAFVIDAIRDIYEAFVIYCFFNLLLGYLGGERSLLILLHGREPKHSVFPVSLFKREIDVSDPYMFLFLKRGIIQYVEVKPVLAVATLILKAAGKFNEGNLKANSGYLYVSIVYNISICLSLYCLAIFWMCVNEDLKPYRPMPKFLCVKGILFFSFWQAMLVSVLVAAGAIKQLGPYTDSEHISLGLTDTLICFEMPFFAVAHMYAFSHTDYIDRHVMYAARMPILYALRDALGLKDVVEDARATLRGEGMDYREFEPAEGFIHQGSGRDRRIKAGLRYANGGQQKYWLPMPADVTERDGTTGRTLHHIGDESDEEVYAPLLEHQVAAVVHDAHDASDPAHEKSILERKGFELPFGDLDEEDEILYEHSRNYLFGDYLYPCIDASSEYARRVMWEEEERVLRNERGAYFSPIRGAGLLAGERRLAVYGAVRSQLPSMSRHSSGRDASPDGSNKKNKGRAQDSRRRVDSESRVPAWRDDERIIDKIDNLAPGIRDGVRMYWTKDARRPDGPKPTISPGVSVASLLHDALTSSVSPDYSSRSDSPAPKKHLKPLPSDAIDLMVQNDVAAEAENIRERKKGEPAVRGAGYRKAYTQGYFVPDAKLSREGLGESANVEPTSHAATKSDIVSETTIAVPGLPVARAVTPPPHAQVEVDRTTYVPDEENPWA